MNNNNNNNNNNINNYTYDDSDIMVRVAFKAAQYETVEKVKRYIELEGIPINSKYEGNTFLHVAVKGGNIDVANYIIQIAKKKELKDLKEVLLDSKNSQEGDTALTIAVQNSHWSLCLMLLKNGCNPCIVNSTGKSTLHYYVERILFEEHQEQLCKEIWKIILNEHENQLLINIPTFKERGFNTAIHLSARKMKLFLCRDLLKSGADALQLNSDFQSFVHIALSRKLNQQQTQEIYQLINEIVKDDPKKTLCLLYIRDINRKGVYLLAKEFGSQTLSNLFVKFRKELTQNLLNSYSSLCDQFFWQTSPAFQDVLQNPTTSNVLQLLRTENGFIAVINRLVDDFHQLFSIASTFYDMVAYSEPKKCLNDYRKLIFGLRDLICEVIPQKELITKDCYTKEDVLAELYYNVLNDVLYIIRDKNHISDMIIGLKYNQKVNPSSLHPEIGEFFNEENLPLWDYPIKLMELVTTSRHPRDKICNLRAASDEIRRVLSTFKAPEEDVLLPTFNYTFLLAKVPYPKSELFLISEIWDAGTEKSLTQWGIAIDYLISYGFGQDGSIVPPAQQHVEEFKCLINHLNSLGAKDDLNLLAMVIYYLVNTPTVCIPGRQFAENTMGIVSDWMKRRGIELCYDKIFKGIRVDQIKPVLSSGDYCEMLSAFES